VFSPALTINRAASRDRYSPRINEGISRLLEQSAAVVTRSGDEFDGNYSVKIAIASARARARVSKQASEQLLARRSGFAP
jgi:hypothetical protein